MRYSSGIIITLSVLLIASVSIITINADLEQNKILNPDTKSYKIPAWLKSNAYWWSQGFLSDDEYSYSIQFLINENIIQVCDDDC